MNCNECRSKKPNALKKLVSYIADPHYSAATKCSKGTMGCNTTSYTSLVSGPLVRNGLIIAGLGIAKIVATGSLPNSTDLDYYTLIGIEGGIEGPIATFAYALKSRL